MLDGTGKVVWAGEAPDKTTGIHDFTWDGKSTTGNRRSRRQVYTLKVTAKTPPAAAVDAQVLTRGRITGVEMYDGAALPDRRQLASCPSPPSSRWKNADADAETTRA